MLIYKDLTSNLNMQMFSANPMFADNPQLQQQMQQIMPQMMQQVN